MRYQLPQVILIPVYSSEEAPAGSDDAKVNLKFWHGQTGTSRDFYMPNNHTTWPLMTAVDFLHHENPPTGAGVEPATLGADGQRQTSYATQSGTC
ncbi:hypothetical protein TNCV_4532241 [Trichonephila clavipes]|nr:hypothetical protein TNCV_4532241 [Trichonephila clavipes]